MIGPLPTTGGRTLYVCHPERGDKHTCTACAMRFFDLLRLPVTCPGCGTAQPPPRPRVSWVRAPGRRLPIRMVGGPAIGAEADKPSVLKDDGEAILDAPDEDAPDDDAPDEDVADEDGDDEAEDVSRVEMDPT